MIWPLTADGNASSHRGRLQRDASPYQRAAPRLKEPRGCAASRSMLQLSAKTASFEAASRRLRHEWVGSCGGQKKAPNQLKTLRRVQNRTGGADAGTNPRLPASVLSFSVSSLRASSSLQGGPERAAVER